MAKKKPPNTSTIACLNRMPEHMGGKVQRNSTPHKTPTRTYWEKLKDPRWQRKRLEVMKQADFACECCGDCESTLNVHHGYYKKGAEPWEYPSETLHCLCEACHESAESLLGDIHRHLAGLSIEALESLWDITSSWYQLLPPGQEKVAKSFLRQLPKLRGMGRRDAS